MDQEINHPEIFSTDNEQNLLIEEMAKIIDRSTNNIISSFRLNQLNVALEAAAKLVNVLRTSQLTPKNYYTVYTAVSSSLSIISNDIKDEKRFTNEMVAELYEVAQYNPICMQRLYIMISVAPELCRRKIVRTADILDDLSDMTRAAQDPIRALFLRHYFLTMFEDRLPDSTTVDAERSANFLLNNFAQMNRLWVRIEDMMASDERRNQRSEFSSLIGKNIECLSRLKNITVESYTTIVFPFLIKHVELCEDSLAQDFILKSIIKYFPPNFHLATIDNIFAVFSKTEQGVNVLDIVNLLLETLQKSNFVDDLEKGSFVFITIAKNIEELFTAEGHLSLESKFETLAKMLKFSLQINKNDLKNIKNLLKFTEFHIDLAISDSPIKQFKTSQLLTDVIDVPLDSIVDGKVLYSFDYLPVLIKRMRPEHQLYIADKITHLFIDSETKITNETELSFYINCTGSIITDSHGTSTFFSIFQLIEGETFSDTVLLLIKFYKSFENIKFVSRQRLIQPFSMRFIHLLYYSKTQTESINDSTKNEARVFLFTFLQESEKISPYNVILIYLELFKISIRDLNSDLSQVIISKIPKLIPEIQEEQSIVYLSFSLLQMISFYINLVRNHNSANIAEKSEQQNQHSLFHDHFIQFRGHLEEMVDRIKKKPTKIKLLCNILIINTEVIGEKSLQKHLQNIYSVINDNSENDNIKEKVLSLYSFLDTILYFIDKDDELQVSCKQILKQIYEEITLLHKKIIDSGKKLEDMVSMNGVRYYINLAKYVKLKSLIK